MAEGDRVKEAIVGGDNPPTDTAGLIGQAAKRLEDLAGEMKAAKADDTARIAGIEEEQKKWAGLLSDLQASHDAERHEARIADAERAAKAALEYASGVRSPSKAGIIGSGAHLVPSMGGYQRGAFIAAIDMLNRRDVFDEDRRAAKAALEAMGSFYQTPEEAGSKATLGTTDATGGWILPNAIVDALIKPGAYQGSVERLVTPRTGLAGATSVDIPFRRSAPNRAVVATWGSTKENVNLTYEGYTATLYTLARIHDVTRQMVRKSSGAAEQDVMEELAHAFALGRSYYILQGSGSSEPYGIQTALALGGASGFTESFTASATTLAGSVAKAIATLGGALASRNRTAEAAILAGTAYWTMLSQGTDSAGFFFNPASGPTAISAPPGTLVTPWGVPVYPENQLAGSNDLIVAEWSALKVYYGESYRVDSSDVAGSRWDDNLVGFRGEQEMGLDARPAVFAGAFGFVAAATP